MTNAPDVLRRLDRLESESRRWRRLAGALALLLTASLALAWVAPADDEVRAQSFLLVDEGGAIVARWDRDKLGHPQFHMLKDKQQVFLTTNGPGMVIRGGEGKRGAFLGVEPSGAVKLELKSERFIDGLRMVVQPDGGNGLYSLDARGFERAHLETLADGTTSVGVRNERGGVRGTLGVDANSTAHLLLLDGAGQRRLGLVQPTEPVEPTIFAMQDAAGRVRGELSTNLDGSPSFKLYSSVGDASFEAP